jgi:decaprenyl-phosphate phosphoribosyltransferase
MDFRSFISLVKFKHWVKNLIIFAPLIFSLSLFNYTRLLKSLIAFTAFSLVTVLVYIINDIIDKKNDQLHPKKSLRPIAAGRIKVHTAVIIGVFFFTAGIFTSLFLDPKSLLIILIYFFVNILYSLVLKQVVILDVFIVALGFCFRILLGAVAINVNLSHWMLLFTFTISLFMGFGKRRYEIEILGEKAFIHRNILRSYNKNFLDILIVISVSLTAISYSLYTMDAEIISRFGTDNLIFTIPFVLYGLFRYLLLIYCKNKGGNPEELVVTDIGIIISGLLWFLAVIFLIYFRKFINIDLSFLKLFFVFFS